MTWRCFLLQILFQPIARGFLKFLRRDRIFDPAVDDANPPLNIDHFLRDGSSSAA